MFRFFLLDADNTLFDFDRAEKNAWFKAFKKNGLPSPTDEMYSVYHSTNAALWRLYEKGGIEKADLVVERHRSTFEKLGIVCDPAVFNTDYMSLLADGNFILPGALDFIKKLRAVADDRHGGIYIITNGVEKTQRKRLADSEIAPYIDDIFVSEAAGYPKPDVRYFDYALSRIPGFDKSESVIVGDSLSSDIKGANNVGITSVWFDLEKTGLPADAPSTPDCTATDHNAVFNIITA